MKTDQEQNIVQKILGRLMSSLDEPIQSDEGIKNMLAIQPGFLLPGINSIKTPEEGTKD